MNDEALLTEQNVAALPPFETRQDRSEVTLVKKYNHVFRIRTGVRTSYLKTHTKSWYDGNRGHTGHIVLREKTAWRILTGAGLSAPRVVAFDQKRGRRTPNENNTYC